MGQSGASEGAETVIARAHHGSVSKEQRALIEDDLKRGRLPCVVATSSLELGIDMGAVDLVVQIESPPSVASALQRVGRAGHQVGEVSRGVLLPKHRGDLVHTAVAVERMREGAIEALRVPTNPLDVLAQQVVAATAVDEWDVDELFTVVRRSAPFTTLPRSAYDATLDLLSGRYPSDEFRELRPRVVWDRVAGTLTGAAGCAAAGRHQRRHHPRPRAVRRVPRRREGLAGRRARRGDGLRVPGRRRVRARRDVVAHRGHHPRPGAGLPRARPARPAAVLEGRPARPARRARRRDRRVHPRAGRARPGAGAGSAAPTPVSTTGPRRNLVAFLEEQREATTTLPSDRTVLVERFRDELGDWRIVIHSPYGAQVHAPWALAIGVRLRERYGIDAQALPGDDGIVLRVPETDQEPPGADVVMFDADEIEDIVTTEVGGSALFASRFRECAARALLLPRRDPGRRSPLWQQRQRSAQLLEVAVKYPSFPIVLEAVRECLQDVYDVPALLGLMRDLASRKIRVVDVATTQPSPFARSLMFGYVAAFMYEGDSPVAERRAAALSLDQGLLAELLGRVELRELLDPDVLGRARARAAAADPRPAGARRRGRGRPAPAARSAVGRRGGRAQHTRVRRRLLARRCSPTPAGWCRCGWAARNAGPPWRTSPGCATGSASRCRRAPPRCSPSRSTTRWPTWWRGSRAPTGRSRPPTSPRGSGSASRWRSRRCPGWRRRAGCWRASSGRPARAPSGATPRCCGGCGGARSPRCARRSSRSSRRRWAGSCRCGRTSRRPAGGACAASTASSPWSTSWPAAPCPRRRWSRSCSAAGSSTTSRRCSTSSPRPARCCGPATARCPAPTAGCRCTSPTTPT